MKVELLAITPDPEALIERAARTCYQSAAKTGPGTATQLIRRLLESGHESVIEHAYATFLVTGVSRACTHQLVRHRLCAFSQKSQRYVSEDHFEYVTPPTVPPEYADDYRQDMEDIRLKYKKWADRGLRNEDARFLLPNACTSEIVISANFREFRHIFKERALNPHAQWEIREATVRMLRILHEHAQNVFGDLMKRLETRGNDR